MSDKGSLLIAACQEGASVGTETHHDAVPVFDNRNTITVLFHGVSAVFYYRYYIFTVCSFCPQTVITFSLFKYRR